MKQYTIKEEVSESPDYRLVVGTMNNSIGDYDGSQYLLINKTSHVVEVETRILVKAYEYLGQLQSALDQYWDSMLSKEPKQAIDDEDLTETTH